MDDLTNEGFERMQVSPGYFGGVVRFEIETADGTIIRFTGAEAAAHAAAFDGACALADARGMQFPVVLPWVKRGAGVSHG